MTEHVGNFGEPGGVFVDQIRIVYRSIDHPSMPTPRATVVLIIDAGMPIDRERLVREVQQSHETPTDLDRVCHTDFVSEERLRHTNWGASGTSLELLMWVSTAAVSGIVGNIAYDGLKSVAARRRALHEPPWKTRPLNGQNAQIRARQMAQAAWPDLGEPVTVLSCNLDGDTATVVLRAPDGSTITAQPTTTRTDAIGPITRAYPEQP
ncbi:hypothetical protein [Mycolicibacterium goodii]|uniref:hypothetical protein n=1 Tax=Mycolicibacterium goodii TaxID=134601 RepID=UPI001BDD2D36|nr:hypothetical protein [Mycolicibacterium goodii]MBU8829894.1 hypothetical protein [Mycolicibacterium goodii]